MLIRRLADQNGLRGAERIRGELLKLGVTRFAQQTIVACTATANGLFWPEAGVTEAPPFPQVPDAPPLPTGVLPPPPQATTPKNAVASTASTGIRMLMASPEARSAPCPLSARVFDVARTRGQASCVHRELEDRNRTTQNVSAVCK